MPDDHPEILNLQKQYKIAKKMNILNIFDRIFDCKFKKSYFLNIQFMTFYINNKI